MASHAAIELEAKIQYIIDGAMKNLINLLYSVTTIKDLRQRFLQYETQKINRDKLKQQLNVATKKKIANQTPVNTTNKM